MKSLTVPKILPFEYPPPIPAPHTRTGTSANRLVRIVANTVVGPQQRLDFACDHQRRRITKGVWNNTAGTGALAVDQKFPYDVWKLVAVLGAVNTLLRSFAWGTDLSGICRRWIKGFYASGTGCPEYLNFGRPGNVVDTPKGVTGPVKFITCQVCTNPCCTRGGPGTNMRIVACKAWKKGDTGGLGQSGAFRDATAGERTMLENALSTKYPDWRDCYKNTCNG
ncbi:MAG: hypothetical protein NTX27_20595 [Verrucomicrobia bacterium]|nr:hypothetical protein [Verrucomicrobiota bacterium]